MPKPSDPPAPDDHTPLAVGESSEAQPRSTPNSAGRGPLIEGQIWMPRPDTVYPLTLPAGQAFEILKTFDLRLRNETVIVLCAPADTPMLNNTPMISFVHEVQRSWIELNCDLVWGPPVYAVDQAVWVDTVLDATEDHPPVKVSVDLAHPGPDGTVVTVMDFPVTDSDSIGAAE